MKYRKTLLEQFENKYEVITETGCWIWTGALASNGYGHIRRDGGIITAHKASYMLYKGDIPDGHDVCHRCDVRCCANPDHLWLGSRSDNLCDMMRKSRHNRVLTYEQALVIKASTKKVSDLALEYNCSETMIYNIKSGRQWNI